MQRYWPGGWSSWRHADAKILVNHVENEEDVEDRKTKQLIDKCKLNFPCSETGSESNSYFVVSELLSLHK